MLLQLLQKPKMRRPLHTLVILYYPHPPVVWLCVDGGGEILIDIVKVLAVNEIGLRPVLYFEDVVVVVVVGWGEEQVVDVLWDVLLPQVDIVECATTARILNRLNNRLFPLPIINHFLDQIAVFQD